MPVYCLGDLFNAPDWNDRTAFYDACHLTEAANEAVARAMLPPIERVLGGME